jgi:hypothetical protein
MHDRVEPMKAEDDLKQPFVPDVAPLVMGKLMQAYQAKFLIVCGDFRQHHGYLVESED